MVKLWVVLVRDLGPMMMTSDLSQLRLRKFICIQDLISLRQLVRVDNVAGVIEVVEMYSWMSSA